MTYPKTFLLTLLLFVVIGLHAQTEQQGSVWRRTLQVTLNNGQIQEFVLERGTRVGNLGAFLEFLNTDQTVYLPLDSIRQMSYGRKPAC